MLIENTSLHLVAPATPEEVQTELAAFLATPSKNLQDFITKVAIDGGTSSLAHPVQALPIFRTSDTSGYNYSYNKKMMAYIRFGITTSGYFVVQSLLLTAQASWVSHYYHADGSYAFSEGPITHTFSSNSSTVMETNCPIVNHLYNILADEYLAVNSGRETNSRRVYTIETTLQRLEKTRPHELSISQGMRDQSVDQLNQKMMTIDLDPVYTWKERHRMIDLIKEERSQLLNTKRRAHKKNIFSYTLPLIAHDTGAAVQRFIKRPLNNFLGALDRVAIDPIRWFLKVVRGNMGLSVAMAIYSPFTYFFITQPMNPHATFAVGKVRSAYIATMEAVEHVFGIEDHTVDTKPKQNLIVMNSMANTQASSRGMLLTTDIPEVNNQSWDDRMSNFKNMQNSYETNMEIAPRMGRLEQMETQLNWPLIVESTWNETERYANFLVFVESNAKDYLPSFVEFVKAEKARTEQVELYLWDRNVRFILDHPFTMMDQSKDQTQIDYYVGRAFIQLRDMTNALSARYKGLAMPAGYQAIAQLANHFETEYKSGGSVLDRLNNNSKLFSQKNKLDSEELRTYMKRQWEILYLLQSRVQEGALHALQMQVWSVRNVVFILQSLYAAKRDEMSMLALFMKPGAPVNKLTTNLNFKRIDSQYEALFHMMVLEYTSIRKEIGEDMKNDIESTQRKTLIDGVENFLKERDTLLKGANLL